MKRMICVIKTKRYQGKKMEKANNCRDILCQWFGKTKLLNNVNISILLKAFTNEMQSLLKFQWHISQKLTNNTNIFNGTNDPREP